jgi:hypothetical protein
VQVRTHALPAKYTMVGGLALDPASGSLFVGLANNTDFVARFDTQSGSFLTEAAAPLLKGYSYVHRSIVPAPDGRVYVGVTWVASVKPGRGRPVPFSPGAFGAVFSMMRFFGGMLSQCRILRREADGTWATFADGKGMSGDLHWDPVRRQLMRLTAKGVMAFAEDGRESLVAPSMKGFVHEMVTGPKGELILTDAEGNVYLVDQQGGKIKLGNLEDEGGEDKAAPGIDGIVRVGEHFLVGGTRNRARPFVIDLRVPSLQLLPPCPTAPRASAFAVAPDGTVLFAAGVGTVGIYRIDPARAEVTALGKLVANGVACHHLHDLVVVPDGRIFGGEFYPLDVPKPPWPDRECLLWEIVPGA